jgi:4-hydroxybenzoate polyprenyltransferase
VKLRIMLEAIKFEHTVFALPFAYLGTFLAAGGKPTLWQLVWVTLAMTGARTAAMAANRLIDRHIDAANPRTRSRALPQGILRPAHMMALMAGGSALLVLAAAMLNPICLYLSPAALALVTFYPYTKRFTWLSHLFLGLADAAAPMGGWLAVRPTLDLPAVLLSLAVALWVGGFDVIYACQDVEFDRAYGLHSLPARFGLTVSLWVSAIAHLTTLALLAFVGILLGRGIIYWAGLGIAAVLLAYEHSIVSPKDLSRINVAFFNVNGYIALAVGTATLLDLQLTIHPL